MTNENVSRLLWLLTFGSLGLQSVALCIIVLTQHFSGTHCSWPELTNSLRRSHLGNALWLLDYVTLSGNTPAWRGTHNLSNLTMRSSMMPTTRGNA